MRYLNKIIFINSASVKYSEINLDGNVHFIGTQGVGKSTLLRAILFFYNAKKDKLGISRGKQTFDKYYFQCQNSYIVYEVKVDGIYFCVLAYKENDKVAFRFFDSAYKREFFVDSQGFAFDDWVKVRNALGDIYSTNKITSYEEYRQILYGDNKGFKSEYRKYALLESSQYKNIPRTIANVLLNSNLEASFIKETIVNSINEDEFKIDLENYETSYLKDFEREIEDIRIWRKKDKNGQINIRNQADKIIENNKFLKFLQQDKQELSAKLSSRMDYIKANKPKFLISLESEKSIFNGLDKEQKNLQEKYIKQNQKNISEIAHIKKQLLLARDKQKEYENKKIQIVIEKVSKKQDLENEKEAKEQEQEILTLKFGEISQKYKSLSLQVEAQRDKFNNQQQSTINSFEGGFNDEKLKINDFFNELIEQIKTANSEEKTKIENDIKILSVKQVNTEKEIAELKHKRFYEVEIKECENKKNEYKNNILTAKNICSNKNIEDKNVRKEWELENNEIIRKYDLSIKGEQKNRKKCRDKIDLINSNLDKNKSSLYGWLNDNVDGWEDTIGKVIDEEHVLFNSNLNPKLSNKQEGFFGLELNLNALNTRVKTLEEYSKEIEILKQKIKKIDSEIITINDAKDNELKKLKKNFKQKLKTLKDTIFENEKIITPNNERKIKENKLIWDEFITKARVKKQDELQKFNSESDKNALKEEVANKKLDEIRKKIAKDTKKKEKEKTTQIIQIKTKKDDAIKIIKDDIKNNNDKSKGRLKELNNEEYSELKQQGGDTERLKTIKNSLEKIKDSLLYIKNNEVLIIEYNKDKRELFDKIPKYKNDKNTFESKQELLEKFQKAEQTKLSDKLKSQKEKVDEIDGRIKEFNEDEKVFNSFIESDEYLSIQQYLTTGILENKTTELAIFIIADLRKNYADKIKRFNYLRESISRFMGNFGEDNVFKLKVKSDKNAHLVDFAFEIEEFIEEGKINEIEEHVNERFISIVHHIASETRELISKRTDIEKIIRKINQDCADNNFVEAIKEMEMRVTDSSNPVVILLLKIRDFFDKNDQILGERNLFNIGIDANTENKKIVELLSQLLIELGRRDNKNGLTLSESFDLQFRIVENDNDSNWVEKLSSVGSEGTDVLVKAMLNILLLNVFKDNASKKFKDFKLHCPMDEIGKLHPNNVKGILKFANERNIFLINASPISLNATAYKHTYKLSKNQSKIDNKYITKVIKLTSQIAHATNS